MSEEETPPTQPDKKPQRRKIKIDIPKELQAIYANVALITHAPSEMVLDFAQVLPRGPHGRVQARVIMSPMHAKMLQMALAQNLANYERKYGEIRLPRAGSALADSLFRFPQEDGDDDKGDS
jgi:hypothetical protein